MPASPPRTNQSEKDKAAADPGGLESLYHTLQGLLPILKAYAICLGIFKELEQSVEKYKPYDIPSETPFLTEFLEKEKFRTGDSRWYFKYSLDSEEGEIKVGLIVSWFIGLHNYLTEKP